MNNLQNLKYSTTHRILGNKTEIKCQFMLIRLPKNKIIVQFSSITQSCLILCNQIGHRMPATLSISNSQSLPKHMYLE